MSTSVYSSEQLAKMAKTAYCPTCKTYVGKKVKVESWGVEVGGICTRLEVIVKCNDHGIGPYRCVL